jgi:hypothetical protein
MRIKRKFADIVPVIVGRVTLRADAMAETIKKHSACVRFRGLHWLTTIAVTKAPITLTEPMYILAALDKD